MHNVLAAGSWRVSGDEDCIVLDYDQRHRRRLRLTTARGQHIALDLARAQLLRHGDGLAEDGGIIRVEAAAEAVMDIHAAPGLLVRIAWHLGNRHLAVQLCDGTLRIRADHVIAGMVEGLGGHVHALQAPFEPEEGAYAQVVHGGDAASAGGHAHGHGGDDHHHG